MDCGIDKDGWGNVREAHLSSEDENRLMMMIFQ